LLSSSLVIEGITLSGAENCGRRAEDRITGFCGPHKWTASAFRSTTLPQLTAGDHQVSYDFSKRCVPQQSGMSSA
jgi:hypothetical protein